MPDEKPKTDLTNEAHRIATDAVDATEAFAKAAVNLPVDSAKLALDSLKAAVRKIEEVVTRAKG